MTIAKAWVVEIPGHTARLNQLLGNWRRAAGLKRKDRRTVAVSCVFARVPKATSKRRVSLHVVLGPRQRAGDVDAYWKSLLDALKWSGVIKDDSRQWCELGPVEYSREAKARMFVTLTDIK